MGIIIAAGALFTAVYDVLYRYNSSNTTNLNAATAGVRWGSDWGDYNYFEVYGTKRNGSENANVNFDNGTYMVFFAGQVGEIGLPGHASARHNVYGWDDTGTGAMCLAFYKGNSMTVSVGDGGGTGTLGSELGYPDNAGGTGGGKTTVATNFALPMGYAGMYNAEASGGGCGSVYASHTSGFWNGPEKFRQVVDGTFKGWEGSSWTETFNNMGVRTVTDNGNNATGSGTPATQTGNGYTVMSVRSPNGSLYHQYPDTYGADWGTSGGGAGYYDGGASYSTWVSGGGSCTPWCYPLITSDTQRYIEYAGGGKVRGDTGCGFARFFRIDPYARPSGSVVAYGNGDAWLNAVWTDRYTPESVVRAASTGWQYWGENGTVQEFDCGMRTGWVYSVSEDGKSWQGVGPEK